MTVLRADFEKLYQRHADDVYRFAFWLSGDRADADDLTAEAFARAWVARDRIRVETVKTYLLTITRNAYLKLRRQTHAEVATVNEPATATSEEEHLLQQEELHLVWSALQQVREEDRSAFLMRVAHELPYQEIARALRISVSSARVKVHRVRLRLALARERG